LDGLETHPVSLRPEVLRNDGYRAGGGAPDYPRTRAHIDLGHRPDVPLPGACSKGPGSERSSGGYAPATKATTT
jgi:hypothetical protein